jgi:hypothetical protein
MSYPTDFTPDDVLGFEFDSDSVTGERTADGSTGFATVSRFIAVATVQGYREEMLWAWKSESLT